jgi:hypothetical protein
MKLKTRQMINFVVRSGKFLWTGRFGSVKQTPNAVVDETRKDVLGIVGQLQYGHVPSEGG